MPCPWARQLRASFAAVILRRSLCKVHDLPLLHLQVCVEVVCPCLSPRVPQRMEAARWRGRLHDWLRGLAGDWGGLGMGNPLSPYLTLACDRLVATGKCPCEVPGGRAQQSPCVDLHAP